MNLAYYSLSRNGNPAYDQQWIQSIRSLRRYNRDLQVCLVVYNGISDTLLSEAARQNVLVLSMGSYTEFLCKLSDKGSELSLYPTLHKFLSLCELDIPDYSQVLYLDCDTFFFDDPLILFAACSKCDWYAREAPTSRRCPHGYDPRNIDESILDRIAGDEGLSPIHPFNAGVCLMNNNIWKRFGDASETFLDTMWRLLVGRHQQPADGTDDHIRRAVLARTTETDRRRALPYPSSNFWIAEEIALWLTLSGIPGATREDISSDHLQQGNEFTNTEFRRKHPVLAHYFSSFQQDFFSRHDSLPY